MEFVMRSVPFALAASFFTAGFLALAPIAAAEETRSFDLPEFDRIDVSAGVVLVADIGAQQSVIVKTNKGDYSDFAIEVRNGELNISREWNPLSWHNSKSDYKVIVSVPTLAALDASSGSRAKVFNIDAARFVIDLSSGAHALLEGKCENCLLDLSSGADLEAKGLECDNADIDVSSGGHGVISVLSTVKGGASSGGHVAVYGNPSQVKVSKSSGGRIKIIAIAQATRD
jgi:Putative auto-transporter adhesin, head GIN domain